MSVREFDTLLTAVVDPLAEMAAAGGGITRLASFVANDLIAAGRLEPLFMDRAGRKAAIAEPLEFYACYLERRDVPVKVRRFIDHLAAHMDGHPGLQAPTWPRSP